MSIDAFQILVSLLLFVSITLFIYSLFRYPVPAEPPIQRRFALALGLGMRNTVYENPVLTPLMSIALTMARRFSYTPLRERIRRDLDAAGNPQGYTVEEYLALCLACAIALSVATAAAQGILLLQFEPFSVFVMLLAGFYGPIYSLRSAAISRISRISKKLPYTLDLVALTMAAGSTFTEAIDTVIRDEPEDDFNQELAIVQGEITLGTQRALALKNMAERVPLDSLRSVVGAVVQAEMLGTPLSEILKSQSGMLRMHRSVRAEKLSASASLRILIPSMLILLAVVLIIFGPLFLRWSAGELGWG